MRVLITTTRGAFAAVELIGELAAAPAVLNPR
jgi:hypothetical protein